MVKREMVDLMTLTWAVRHIESGMWLTHNNQISDDYEDAEHNATHDIAYRRKCEADNQWNYQGHHEVVCIKTTVEVIPL